MAYYRGLVVSKSSKKGLMIAVGLDRHAASLEISDLGIQDRVRIACVNSPENVTLSGDEPEIGELIAHLNDKGIFVRSLRTGGKAYHSHHMASLGEKYYKLMSGSGSLTNGNPLGKGTRMFSSVTGRLLDGTTAANPDYWRTNLESPVLFQDAIEALLEGEKYHLIEIGPHQALELPVKQICASLQMPSNQMKYSHTLSRGKNSTDCMLTLSGVLYLHGNDILFEKINRIANPRMPSQDITPPGRIIYDLPNYKWDYSQFLWYEPRRSSEFRNRKYLRHDLLRASIHGGPGGIHLWRNVLHEKDIPWLKDHKLNGEIVLPGAAYIAIVIEALHQVQPENFLNSNTLILRKVRFLNALILSRTSQVEIFTQFKQGQLSETSLSTKWWHFEISSYINDVSAVTEIPVTFTPRIKSTNLPFL